MIGVVRGSIFVQGSDKQRLAGENTAMEQ
jgi:hypothetical protein